MVQRGIADGSIVPSNILLDYQGHLWIADFGSARLHPPPQPYLAPEHYSVAQHSLRTVNMAPYWEAVNPASDQFMLAVLCQQVMARIFQPSEYETLLPVLQRASNQHPTHRFANIDTFVHELMVQATRGQGLVTTGPLRTGAQATSTPYLWRNSSSAQFTSASYPQYERAATSQLAMPAIAAPIDDWEKRGDKLFTMRDYDGAAQAYRQAIETNGGKDTLWLALGDAYFALENHAEALKAYEQAVRLNPGDPLTWSNRGTALDALGRHKEAVECYDRADQLR